VRSPRQASDGLHGVIGTPSLPVWLLGDPPPAAPLGILVPLDDLTPRRMAAALRLWHALHGRPGQERGITRDQRRQLILRLRALDGHAEGAALRDLARGLFGADHVPDGPAWKTHELRSRTLRLLATARSLRDSGYRELLTAGPSVRL
jgi:hypothetical protein